MEIVEFSQFQSRPVQLLLGNNKPQAALPDRQLFHIAPQAPSWLNIDGSEPTLAFHLCRLAERRITDVLTPFGTALILNSPFAHPFTSRFLRFVHQDP